MSDGKRVLAAVYMIAYHPIRPPKQSLGVYDGPNLASIEEVTMGHIKTQYGPADGYHDWEIITRLARPEAIERMAASYGMIYPEGDSDETDN